MFAALNVHAEQVELWKYMLKHQLKMGLDATFTDADGNIYVKDETDDGTIITLCRLADEHISAHGTTIPATVSYGGTTHTVAALLSGFLGGVVDPETIENTGAVSVSNPVVQSLVVPEEVSMFGSYCFAGQSELTSVTFLSQIMQVYEPLFAGCTKLQDVYLHAWNLADFKSSAFKGCPEGMTLHVGTKFSSEIDEIKSDFSLSNVVADIVQEPVELWKFFLTVGMGSYATFTDADGNIYAEVEVEQDVTAIVLCRLADENISAQGTTIPATVSYRGNTHPVAGLLPGFLGGVVDPDTFEDTWTVSVSNPVVQSLVVPEEVFMLLSYSFAGQSELTSVTFLAPIIDAEGGSLFYGCTKLQDVYLHAWDLEDLKSSVFEGCPEGMTLHVGTKLSSEIDKIKSDYSLSNVVADVALEPIELWKYASWESGMSSYSTFTAADGNIYYVAGENFALCRLADENISADGTTIPTTVSYGGETHPVTALVGGFLGGVFDPNTEAVSVSNPVVQSLVVPEGVTRLAHYCFAGQRKLDAITLPEGVAKIDRFSFYDCTSLGYVVLPASLSDMGNSCFDGCPSYMVVLVDPETSDEMVETITNMADGRKVMKTTEAFYASRFGVPPTYSTAVDYLTLCSPIPLAVPAKTKAFTGTISGNVLKLKEVVDVIPAQTPVVLMKDGIGNSKASYYYAESSAAPVAGNDLKGVYADTPVTDVKQAGKVVCTLSQDGAFYKYTGETLAANKVYLLVDEAAAAKGLRIEIEGEPSATGITNIQTDSESAPVYNLQGQRVGGSAKGILIKNGKKFVVR